MPLPGAPDTQRYRLFEAVTAVTERITRQRPLLLVLDDLHWADQPTVLLLRHLLRGLSDQRVMILATYRDVEVRPSDPLPELLGSLRREGWSDRRVIGGLDEAETQELVMARAGRPADPSFARRLRANTHGNPFFIEELLWELRHAEPRAPRDALSEDDLAQMGVPREVEEVIVRRLGRLDPSIGDVLTAAAVIGRQFRFEVLAAGLDRPTEDVLDALEAAMAAGLVLEHSEPPVGRFSFCHALVRETLYARLTRTRRARLHAFIGQALSAHEAPRSRPAPSSHITSSRPGTRSASRSSSSTRVPQPARRPRRSRTRRRSPTGSGRYRRSTSWAGITSRPNAASCSSP